MLYASFQKQQLSYTVHCIVTCLKLPNVNCITCCMYVLSLRIYLAMEYNISSVRQLTIKMFVAALLCI